MIISAIDLETNTDKKPFITHYQSEEVALRIYGPGREILLPPCEESHEIAGGWLLANIPLKPNILTEPVLVDVTDYGFQPHAIDALQGGYRALPTFLFREVPGWELVASHDPFHNVILLRFLPKQPWRNKNASTTGMSFR